MIHLIIIHFLFLIYVLVCMCVCVCAGGCMCVCVCVRVSCHSTSRNNNNVAAVDQEKNIFSIGRNLYYRPHSVAQHVNEGKTNVPGRIYQFHMNIKFTVLTEQKLFQNQQITLKPCSCHFLKNEDSQISWVCLLAIVTCFFNR